MNTKKFFYWMLTAGAALGLSLAIASCSKDKTIDDKTDEENVEPASVLTLDSDYMTRGIETDMQSAVIEVPVKCDGLWTATLPADVNWVQILDWQVAYKGDATLTLAFDENLTKADRITTLTLGDSYGEYRTVTVRQNYSYQGEAPDNGNGLAFANKGVGTGIDYDYALNVKEKQNTYGTFDPTRVHLMNNLFNIGRIEELTQYGKLKQSAYREAVFTGVGLQELSLDEILAPGGGGLRMASSFGVLAFETRGDYSPSLGDRSRSYADYILMHNAPTSYVYFSPAELSEYAAVYRGYDEQAENAAFEEIESLIAAYQSMNRRRRLTGLNEDGLTAAQQAQIDAMYEAIPVLFDYAGIYSASFKNIYNKLYNAIELPRLRGQATDKASADQTLDLLDGNFGPFFIAGGEFGGSLTLHCKVDASYFGDAAPIDLSSALQEIEALFSGSYTASYEEAYVLLRTGGTSLTIFGGNANETADAMMEILLSGSASDLQRWPGLLQNWQDQLQNGQGWTEIVGQGAPISFILYPIWMLFYESAIREYAENYFMEKYASRGIAGYLDIMNRTSDSNTLVLDIVGYDFWK